jgi:hypothetical protein
MHRLLLILSAKQHGLNVSLSALWATDLGEGAVKDERWDRLPRCMKLLDSFEKDV